jgi:tol-pal system protein YbgF
MPSSTPRTPSTIALSLASAALASVALAGCARSAEERQLDDMRSEIERIQESRDQADRATMEPEAAESKEAPMTTPALAAKAEPADEDAVTLGTSRASATDDYADTEDPTPRPSIRVLGSARGAERGSWRGQDRVEETAPDDVATPSSGTKLDPAAATAYDAAMSLVSARQYDRALDALAAFLVRWPDHPYADNAMYWRGECHLARGDYRRAAEQFEGVMARFPAGDKVPDALLKLGITYQKLGDPTKAKAYFDRLTQLYPQSEAARRMPPVTSPASSPRGPASEDRR